MEPVSLAAAIVLGLALGVICTAFFAVAERYDIELKSNFAKGPSSLIYLISIGGTYAAAAHWLGFYGGDVVKALTTAFAIVATITLFDALRLWRLKRQTEKIIDRLDQDPRVLMYMTHVPLRRNRDEHRAYEED